MSSLTPDEADAMIVAKLPTLINKWEPRMIILVCLARFHKDRKVFYKTVEAVGEYQTLMGFKKFLDLETNKTMLEDTIEKLKNKGFIFSKDEISKIMDENKLVYLESQMFNSKE